MIAVCFSFSNGSCQEPRSGPGDEDLRPPPQLPTDVKGKVTKKIMSKKQKYAHADTARAAAMVATAKRAERGGARSGV